MTARTATLRKAATAALYEAAQKRILVLEHLLRRVLTEGATPTLLGEIRDSVTDRCEHCGARARYHRSSCPVFEEQQLKLPL